MKKKIIILLTMGITLSSLYTQNQYPPQSTSPLEEEVLKNGAWLISKSDADLEQASKTLNLLLSKQIIPQALDRNFEGELLIISQLSPPAQPARRWLLGLYESEKNMMAGMELEAKEGWYPTAMDVQHDAAFVLYLKNDDVLSAARLIKVYSIEELEKSIQTYYELQFLPAAISTYEDTLWILFTKTLNFNTQYSTITVRAGDADITDTFLTEELSNLNTSLIDITYTSDEKVIMLFHKINK